MGLLLDTLEIRIVTSNHLRNYIKPTTTNAIRFPDQTTLMLTLYLTTLPDIRHNQFHLSIRVHHPCVKAGRLFHHLPLRGITVTTVTTVKVIGTLLVITSLRTQCHPTAIHKQTSPTYLPMELLPATNNNIRLSTGMHLRHSHPHLHLHRHLLNTDLRLPLP